MLRLRAALWPTVAPEGPARPSCARCRSPRCCARRGGRGVVVAVQAGTTVRAGMPADGEPFLDEHAAAGTGVRGGGRRHRDDRLASCCRVARQDARQCAPAHLATARGEGVILDQVGRRHVCVRAGVVRLHQHQRDRVVEVRPRRRAALVVGAGEERERLAPAAAALRARRDAPRRAPLRGAAPRRGRCGAWPSGSRRPGGPSAPGPGRYRCRRR